MHKAWFTYEEGVILIWLLLAHIFTDFVLQNKKMVEHKFQKGIKSYLLYVHGIIAAFTLWLASGFNLPIWLAILAGISHLIIDILKIKLDNRRTIAAFIIDQLAHLTIIIALWLWILNKWELLLIVIRQLALDYGIMLIVIGYTIMIWPTGILIKEIIKKIFPQTINDPENISIMDDAQKAGRYIGIFERVIILTFVLLNQYAAIGFLITGKSIIRLNTKKQTEYVLLGTMVSYAIAIIVGVILNWLLSLK